MKRLPKNVLEELRGHSWEIRPGGKHPKLLISGVVVTTLPMGNRVDRDRLDLGIIRAIRAHLARK